MRIEDPKDPVDPTPSPEDAAAEVMAAMDKGVEAATPAPEEAAEPAAAPVPGTPEALAAEEAAKAEAAKPADAKPEGEPAKDEPDPHAEIKADADALGLKGKANERFVAMAAEIKTFAPLKAALEQAGIKDAADLPKLAAAAKDGADLVEMVQGTGATPDQFSATLDYLALVNKGDPASLEQAFTALSGELADLAKLMGREVPGVHDPLAEHKDLQQELEAGDITRARALEIAASRTQAKVAEGRRAQETQTAAQRTAAEQATNEGVNALRAWEQQKMAADPGYLTLRPALNAEVAQIRQNFPPAQWAAATELAYRAIVASSAKPAPAAQKPPPGPMRPGMGGPRLAPAVFDNPEDAMEAGIAAATAR